MQEVIWTTLRLAGLTTVAWDVDSGDWSSPGVDAISKAVLGSVQRGSIVLMHCGPAITPTILPAVIDYYRSRGYRFVTIPTLLGW